jgi:DNA-binding response OmpR family regulator
MPNITVALSAPLDAVLRQAASLRGRSAEDVVNAAVSQYLGWKDYEGSNSAIRIGNIELDPTRRLVRKNFLPIHLTPTEFNLLHYLMVHAGLPMAHVRLLRAVWGLEYGGELEYLRTYIRCLRKKLEDDPAEPRYLLTEAYYGYRFADVTVDSRSATHQEPAA